MQKLNILYVTTEIDPFLKLSDAADFIRLLPQKLQEKGHDIRILMPKFGVISERKHKLHEVVRLSGINIRVGNKEKPLTIKVATIPGARLQVYFLDNEDYFQRKTVLTDANDTCHIDNDERSIFFCKGVIETVKKLGWTPNIIHCHGWMTGLLPLYVKTQYRDDPMFMNAKTVFTVYNNEIDHPLPATFLEKARLDGVPQDKIAAYLDSSYLGLAKGGMRMADAITVGSSMVSSPLIEYINQQTIQMKMHDFAGAETPAGVDNYTELYRSILN